MPNGLFSRPCSYALRAMLYLAAQGPGNLSRSEEIAASEDMPAAFLAKVLHPLCRDRFLHSRKGLGGGYELIVPPERISLLDIVRSVDGEPLRDCLLQDRACSCSTPCELHEFWNDTRIQFMSYLQNVTVADLLKTRQSLRRENPRGLASDVKDPMPELRRGE